MWKDEEDDSHGGHESGEDDDNAILNWEMGLIRKGVYNFWSYPVLAC